jgi:hypothetical protein
MNDYDLDLEFGLDDEDLDMDELGLDEDAEFGDDDGPDPDDDMEDLRSVSDDPSDPEDDSGPDINGDQFGLIGTSLAVAALSAKALATAMPLATAGIAAGAGGLLTGGMVLARRARYTRQQRIYRNRYKRALNRVDRKRGGAGVRRRLRKTYLRMKRLWAKLNPRRRTGLKNPAATRKAVQKALGPLPPLMGARSEEDRGGLASSGGPDTNRILRAAGFIPGGGGAHYPQAPGLPPLSQFQRQEIAQQSVATNYAQRFSLPPAPAVRSAGLSPFASPQPQTQPVAAPMGTALDDLAGFTNERLQRIASGGGMGVYSSPVARVKARQVLRSRGLMAPTPVISAGGRPVMGPAGLRQFAAPAPYMPLPPRRVTPAPPALQPTPVRVGPLGGPILPRPSGQAPLPFRPGIQPGGATPFRPAIRPGIAAGGPSALTPRPALPAPAFPRLTPPPALPSGIGMKVSTGPIRTGPLSFRMGFDNYGQEAPAVVVPPDGYAVVPDFTTLGLSAIKEHPIKTAVSVAGLLAAGVFLVKPAVGLIRKISS